MKSGRFEKLVPDAREVLFEDVSDNRVEVVGGVELVGGQQLLHLIVHPGLYVAVRRFLR